MNIPSNKALVIAQLYKKIFTIKEKSLQNPHLSIGKWGSKLFSSYCSSLLVKNSSLYTLIMS
jgi:hypothetical protein